MKLGEPGNVVLDGDSRCEACGKVWPDANVCHVCHGPAIAQDFWIDGLEVVPIPEPEEVAVIRLVASNVRTVGKEREPASESLEGVLEGLHGFMRDLVEMLIREWHAAVRVGEARAEEELLTPAKK